MGDDLCKINSQLQNLLKRQETIPVFQPQDIKVLALTYQLETENVGTEHLKKEPEKRVLMID